MSAIVRTLLLAYVFFLPLLPEAFGFKSQSLPDISFVRAIVFLLMFGLIAGLILDRKLKSQAIESFKEFRVPVLAVTLYFSWLFIASILSPSGVGTIAGAIRDAMYFATPFFAALVCLRSLKDIKIIAMVVAVSAMISGGIGIIEATSGFSLYGELTTADSPWNTLNEEKGSLGTFPHPLAFGSFLAGGLILATILLIGSTGSAIVGLMAMVVALAGIVASTSRGALAGLIAAFALMCILYAVAIYRRVRRAQKIIAMNLIVLPILIIMVVGVSYAGMKLIKGSSAKQAGSSAMRVLQVQLAIPKVIERPIVGYGVGKAAETLGMIAETVDIYYLTVVLESGVVGLLIFIGLLVYFLSRSVGAFLETRHKPFLIISMFFAAEGTQLLVLSLKQAIPLLFVGFALLLVMQRAYNLRNLRTDG